MAFLLGNESCIESLRFDLTDIQETIDDILARTGYLRCYSWKFPDKMAPDIKIPDLLDIYKFSNDETHNQITHYSLLELIIDRLIFLVNLSNMQIEKTLNFNEAKDGQNQKSSSSHGLPNNLSAGLAIKKYWSKFTHLCSTSRQLYCQNKAFKQKQDIKPTDSDTTTTNKRPIKAQNISDDVSNKNTQTIETAFVPCDSCARVQENLKKNADNLINILHFENLPSNLAKFRSSFPSSHTIGWLSANDTTQWLNEQDKDLNKLGKHLEFLSKNNEILKAKISEFEDGISKSTETEKELKKQLKEAEDVRATIMKQYEKKLVDQKTELNVQISNKDNQFKQLSKSKEVLDSQIALLNTIKQENEKTINELNDANRKLCQDLELRDIDKDKFLRLEQDKYAVVVELECKKQELNEKNKELNKERQKLENSIRHEQSLKTKQESLVSSLDQITQECDKLRSQLNSIEADKDGFEKQYNAIINDLKAKDSKIKEYESERCLLTKNIDDLKSSLAQLNNEVKKHKEKELLLLQYPDLYGPLPQRETDLLTDMESQILANRHRIDLLQAQNSTLQISIQRLANANNFPVVHVDNQLQSKTPNTNLVGRPVPLFKLENEIQDEIKAKSGGQYWNPSNQVATESVFNQPDDYVSTENIFVHTNGDLMGNNNDYAVHHPNKHNYISSSRRNSISNPGNGNRSHRKHSGYSGRNTTPVTPSPVSNMEVVIGKGHRPNSATRPQSGMITKRPPSANSNKIVKKESPDSNDKYYCERCFKNYTNKRDLDIHKLYCNK